jgi:hypothetical protein
MKSEKQNSQLIIYILSSLGLAAGILYLLVPSWHLEIHEWSVIILLFLIIWYLIYVVLVLGEIYIWG